MSRLFPLLRPHPLPAGSMIVIPTTLSCTRLDIHRPEKDHQNVRRRRRDDTRGRTVKQTSVEDIFVSALVTAGTCHQYRQRHSPPLATLHSKIQRRCFSCQSPKQQSALVLAPAPREISRKQYESLAHVYPGFPGDDEVERASSELKRSEDQKTHYPLASRLVLTPEQELLPPHADRVVLEPEDEEHARQLRHLKSLLYTKPGTTSQDRLWSAYEALRSPRPRYLTDRQLSNLLRHLSWVEYKSSEEAMRRQMSVLNECLSEHVNVGLSAWNAAILFAGRFLRNPTAEQVKDAIEIWMRMEEHGHRADHVTLNILFQVAVRAGRYALADTIFNELEQRKMPLDRFMRLGLIYYAGVRRDGEAVRKAFRDFVRADEIVDTAVMNCVILSLVRAGETPAAESVFLRMKALHEEKFGTAALADWRDRKNLGIFLNKTAKKLRKEKRDHEASFFGSPFSTDAKREEIQKASPIAPDEITFRIFLKHYAETSGDLKQIKLLMAEVQGQRIHLHGSIYFHLLRGFFKHGGYAFSMWNHRELEDLWSNILVASESSATLSREDVRTGPDDDSFDLTGAMTSDQWLASTGAAKASPESNELNLAPVASSTGPTFRHEVYFNRPLAMAALQAFYKCSGKRRMLEVWEEINARWGDCTDADRNHIQADVDRMVAENSVYVR